MLQSGIMKGDDKGKQPKDSTWVRKAPKKQADFDLERTRETFMEAKKSFVGASTSGSKDKLDLEMDLAMITTFLETCMKLLHDNKVVKSLEELINTCARTALGELRVIRNIGKHKTRTGREMRLTTQMGKYEMDQVILDLGWDANFLLKQTWEQMGRSTVQWSPIQLRMENQQKIIQWGDCRA